MRLFLILCAVAICGCQSRDTQIPFPIKKLTIAQENGMVLNPALVGLYPLYHEVGHDSETWYIGNRIGLGPNGEFHVVQPKSDAGVSRYFNGLFIASKGYDLGFIGWIDARVPAYTGEWVSSAVAKLSPGDRDDSIVRALTSGNDYILMTRTALSVCGWERPELVGVKIRANVDMLGSRLFPPPPPK